MRDYWGLSVPDRNCLPDIKHIVFGCVHRRSFVLARVDLTGGASSHCDMTAFDSPKSVVALCWCRGCLKGELAQAIMPPTPIHIFTLQAPVNRSLKYDNGGSFVNMSMIRGSWSYRKGLEMGVCFGCVQMFDGTLLDKHGHGRKILVTFIPL